MRKIDRLFEIIQLLRGQRLRTAAFIADRLGVSVRTIYRDIEGLAASGLPIEGERGIGYVIRQSIEMPPLHFTPLELQALRLGIDLAKALGDEEIVAAAQEAAIKIYAVLPKHLDEKKPLPIAHIHFESTDTIRRLLAQLRKALEGKRKVQLSYRDGKTRRSRRIVRPLGIEYWGNVWILTAWCEIRNDFRAFRFDRILSCTVQETRFKSERGKTYRDFIRLLETTHHDG